MNIRYYSLYKQFQNLLYSFHPGREGGQGRLSVDNWHHRRDESHEYEYEKVQSKHTFTPAITYPCLYSVLNVEFIIENVECGPAKQRVFIL